MSILKDIEWKQINEIILELYYIEDLMEFQRRTLSLIKPLVPYDQANFRVVDLDSKLPIREKTIFINTSDKMMDVFFEHIVPEKNYLKSLFESEHSLVYNDSGMLSQEVRKKTSFYNNYLLPQNTPHGSGIIFIQDSQMLGALSLFRSDTWGDFTDKEVYMMDILKDHLTKILFMIHTPEAKANPDFIERLLKEDCPLTSRERELVPLIINGYSNDEISDLLNISHSTTKKHIYNIYKKYGVSSRLSLIRKFYK